MNYEHRADAADLADTPAPIPSPALTRLPPHSPEAEAGVLGCILQAPMECLGDCVERLRGPEAFYDLRHRTLYQALLALQDAGHAIDLITLMQALKDRGQLEAVGGLGYLSSLPDAVPSAANLDYYLGIVVDKHLLRRLMAQCTSTVARVYEWEGDVESLVDQFERNAIDLRGDKEVGAVHSGTPLARAFIAHLEDRCAQQGQLTGLATGYPDFDKLTNGLQFREQTIIAARPSQGKTAIGLNIVNWICLRNKIPTAIISLEMSHLALLRRMCAARHNIAMDVLRSGHYEQRHLDQFTAFSLEIKNAPLFIYDHLRGATADRIAAIIRRLVRLHGVRFVLIDYLQKIKASGRHEKRTYEVGEVSGVLKAMAEENNIALLTLAQLSREPEKEKGRQPRLADLADSAQIERDADTIAFIHRDRTDASEGRDSALVIGKQRDGELGKVPLLFNGAYCRFESKARITKADAELITQGL